VRSEFTTGDPDQAHVFLRETYVENTMRIRGSRNDFLMHHTHHDAGAFSVGTMKHAMSVEHQAAPLGYLLVGRVVHGRFERETAGETLRAGPDDVFLIAAPDEPYVARWEEVELHLTRINAEVFTQVSGAGERGAPRLTGLLPVSTAGARHLNATLAWLTGDLLANPEAAASPLVLGAAARGLAAAVLAAFPHDEVPVGAVDRLDGTGAALSRALEFIEAHAHTDISITDVAEAAAMTPGAVRYAFARHMDTTPARHLRAVRLDRVHLELAAADPTRGDTVTAIAHRWGFHHAGRFATAYRQVYGVRPGEALRR
jgi:AraC-like DNA-binding protein